jgi:hypothetical protein
MALAPATRSAAEALLYADDFDSGTSAANWTVISHAADYTADFAFDYSTRGIPPAPNTSGGTTIGMHYTVNSTDAIAALDAVNAYPIGESFTGDHVLRFDMWLGYNGPAGGGVGSTQFGLAGLLHSGNQVVWANNASSDGQWFAVTGEGGDTNDYRAYRDSSLLAVNTAVLGALSGNHSDMYYQQFFTGPTYETVGAPGKHWVDVEISYIKGVLTWRINGRIMAMRFEPSPSVATGNIMFGLMDTFTSIANPPTDTFALFDNVRVTAPDCNNTGVADADEIAAGTSLDCNCNDIPDECETIPVGDFDNDGDTDLTDFQYFLDCLNGPNVAAATTPAACVNACLAAFDADLDGNLDLDDFAEFQRRLTTGPIPPRPAGAMSGRQVAAEVAGLTRAAREARILSEITGGNVPGYLRTFVPISVSANIGGNPTNATYFVSRDYLAIGTDDDFVRFTMTPLIAQPIADAFDCLLPTRKMVNDIYAQATVKLAPAPISPATTDITRMTTIYRHHEMVETQRAGQPLSALLGGIKKDVVITPQLAANPGKVAIYGWHQLNGVPIQPLYLGHADFYVDYSHGIRLVRDRMLVNGVEMLTADVLAHTQLHVLLSDEGVVTNPTYP